MLNFGLKLKSKTKVMAPTKVLDRSSALYRT